MDACVVIDFCGRTENLAQLMAYVDDGAVVTSVVVEELQRQRTRNFPGLQAFLDLIDTGAVSVVDPDTLDPDVTRIIGKWSSQFGAGEVSSAALAISRRFVFVSRDRAPMQQLRLSETILMETTDDVLAHLVRRGAMTKQQSEHIRRDIRAGSERHRRK